MSQLETRIARIAEIGGVLFEHTYSLHGSKLDGMRRIVENFLFLSLVGIGLESLEMHTIFKNLELLGCVHMALVLLTQSIVMLYGEE